MTLLLFLFVLLPLPAEAFLLALLCSALTWFHACEFWFCSYIHHFQFKSSQLRQHPAPVLSRLQLCFQALSWYMVIAHCRRTSLVYLAPTPTCPGPSSERSEQCERLTLSMKAQGRMDASCRNHGCVGLEIWWLLCPVTLLSHNFKVESKNEHNHSISPDSYRGLIGEFFFLQSQQMFFQHIWFIYLPSV